MHDEGKFVCRHSGLQHARGAVASGRNGWVLPVRDEAAFRAALARVFATDKATLREMGARSKAENATFWDTSRAIKAFLDEILAPTPSAAEILV